MVVINTLQTLREKMYVNISYLLAADHHTALAFGYVMQTLVLIHAPIARPVRRNAIRALGMRSTVEVGEITTDEVFIRFGRAHRQRHQYVVLSVRDLWSRRQRRCRTRQTERCDARVYRLRSAENATVFRPGRQFG